MILPVGSAWSGMAKPDNMFNELIMLYLTGFYTVIPDKARTYVDWFAIDTSETQHAGEFAPIDDGYESDTKIPLAHKEDRRKRLSRNVFDLHWVVTSDVNGRLRLRLTDVMRGGTRVSECARRAYTIVGAARPIIDKLRWQALISEVFFVRCLFMFYVCFFGIYSDDR